MWQLESVRTKTIYFNLVYFTLYFGRIQHCGCILCVPYKNFVEINVLGRISIMVEDDQAPEFSLHVYTSFYSTIFGKCNRFYSFLLYLFSSYVIAIWEFLDLEFMAEKRVLLLLSFDLNCTGLLSTSFLTLVQYSDFLLWKEKSALCHSIIWYEKNYWNYLCFTLLQRNTNLKFFFCLFIA